MNFFILIIKQNFLVTETDLFCRGHILHIAATGTSTCPVKAIVLQHDP